MATETVLSSPAEHLERRIQETLIESERWRAEHGDPAAAMGRFLVERFGIDALMATYHEYLEHEDSFLFDDYHDEEGEAGEGKPGGERR